MLVLNVAALSPWEIGDDCPQLSALAKEGSLRPLVAPDPALTCVSHATMLTGAGPDVHGIIGNGWYERSHAQVMNWGRSDGLVNGRKIWEDLSERHPGYKTANLFWRYCTHARCELTVTERPTYFANGRKGADIYASTPELKAGITAACGPFPLISGGLRRI